MKESTFYWIMLFLGSVSIISGIAGKNWEGFAMAGLFGLVSLVNYLVVRSKKK